MNRVYVVYFILVLFFLSMGYWSIDYAINGVSTPIVKQKASSSLKQGSMGFTHSWIQEQYPKARKSE
ncbi:MAG: hypothetical protein OEZ58_11050 [Gammaproteobacteria bacterium]|nr:hypothetical protein [Gammaproteobacteria bacterium]MDH5729520.1 hypothetical protein [Gammaproteobacteria bacterium]